MNGSARFTAKEPAKGESNAPARDTVIDVVHEL
jgi:hypothetical protein